MSRERTFEELLVEFERIGVDPHRFPAGITVRSEDALRLLKSLPDDAGPAAFLARVREVRGTPRGGYPLRADGTEL